ncbi:MAG TPA: glutathione peroxidase [Acetobacteraceae bacterium]
MTEAAPSTAFDFTLNRLSGAPLPLRAYAGRPLLVVNTASRCGFTPQYAGLQALWAEHRGRGLTVLGVPSNDFGGQEPGTAEEIRQFCAVNYGVDFPMAAKVPVRGTAAHPLFRWLGQQGGLLARPRWNFYKYLVGADGRLAAWFGSTTPPGSRRLRAAIDRALA